MLFPGGKRFSAAVWTHGFLSRLQSGTAEVELKKGATLKITLDNAYMEKCDENNLWLDYKNICKVVEVGSKIYVDDGLISLQVKQKGMSATGSRLSISWTQGREEACLAGGKIEFILRNSFCISYPQKQISVLLNGALGEPMRRFLCTHPSLGLSASFLHPSVGYEYVQDEYIQCVWEG